MNWMAPSNSPWGAFGFPNAHPMAGMAPMGMGQPNQQRSRFEPFNYYQNQEPGGNTGMPDNMAPLMDAYQGNPKMGDLLD